MAPIKSDLGRQFVSEPKTLGKETRRCYLPTAALAVMPKVITDTRGEIWRTK